MKTFVRFAVVAAIGIAFSSCSPRLTPFTKNLMQEYNWSEAELRQIQFYLSEDILLTRQIGKDTTEIIGGEITFRNDTEIEKVTIDKGTPGVFVFSPRDNLFAISFEEGDDRYLMFGPNPNVNNQFTLLARRWSREFGTVTYDGKEYKVKFTDAFASLLVDLKKASKTDLEQRRAGGRRIGR